MNGEAQTATRRQVKFRNALDAAKEIKTIAQLMAEHGIHPNQISVCSRNAGYPVPSAQIPASGTTALGSYFE